MKNLRTLAVLAALMMSTNLLAQQKPATTKPYTGAVATKKIYRAVYELNSEDDKKITSTLKNIKNALEDPRLVGKLKVELVVHGGAVIVYKKDSSYEQQLLELLQKGVLLVQCENSIRQRNIKKEELFSFVSYVPTANAELIILQDQGWAIVHP